MREKLNLFTKSCATRPDSYRDIPAAETKSVGLQADAQLSWFLHTIKTILS